MKTKLCPGWVLALLCTVLFFYGFYLGGVQLVISEVSREYGQNAAGMGGLVAAQHVAAIQSFEIAEIHPASPACFVYEPVCRSRGETQARVGDYRLPGRYVIGRASISSARNARIFAVSRPMPLEAPEKSPPAIIERKPQD